MTQILVTVASPEEISAQVITPAALEIVVENNVGMPGPKGDIGAQGPQGIQGEKGDTGDTGADSTVPGPQGIQGETGPQGIQGETGSQGIQGIQGETGPQGFQGETGVDSTVPGPQGIQGDPGADGVALDVANTWTAKQTFDVVDMLGGLNIENADQVSDVFLSGAQTHRIAGAAGQDLILGHLSGSTFTARMTMNTGGVIIPGNLQVKDYRITLGNYALAGGKDLFMKNTSGGWSLAATSGGDLGVVQYATNGNIEGWGWQVERDGSFFMYHNNAIKLSTTAGGAELAGDLSVNTRAMNLDEHRVIAAGSISGGASPVLDSEFGIASVSRPQQGALLFTLDTSWTNSSAEHAKILVVVSGWAFLTQLITSSVYVDGTNTINIQMLNGANPQASVDATNLSIVVYRINE